MTRSIGGRRRSPLGGGLVGLVGLATAMVLAACGGGSKEKEVYAPPNLPLYSTTTTAPTTAPTAPGARAGPTTTGPRGSRAAPSTARPPAGGTPASPAAPASLGPAPAGAYRYDTTGVSTFGLTSVPFPAVTTLTVDPPAGTRQHSTRDLRDPAGNGPVLEEVLDYRPEGVFVEELKITTRASGFTNVQDLRPAAPALLLPSGAASGAHAELDLAGGGATAHATADVLRTERVSVAGQGVDTVVMRIVVTLPPGDVQGRVELTSWVAPSLRFGVKEHFVTDASGAGGLFKFHSQYDAVLQRLP